jgi:hypothetical protein
MTTPLLAAVIATITLPAAQGTKPPGDKQIRQYVRRIFQDRGGHYWFGTNDEGVCRYDGKAFVYFSNKDGLAGNAARGIL